MALRKDAEFMTQGGFHVFVKDAYIKVANVIGDKNVISVSVHWLKDHTVFEPFKVTNFQFTPSMTGQNFIAQAYKHAKTLPDFADSQDC